MQARASQAGTPLPASAPAVVSTAPEAAAADLAAIEALLASSKAHGTMMSVRRAVLVADV